jgi:hypothetical protein
MLSEEDIRIIRAYKNFSTSDWGKIVLSNLREVFKFDMSVVPIGEDAHIDVNRLIRNEGQRSVIIHILSQLNKDIPKPANSEEPKVADRNYIE